MTIKIRTIIIEDEEPARNLLKNFLNESEAIELIDECKNGFEGVKAINDLKPDLIFLDIQMPKITGFEMLELLEFKPHIIFTTAYDQYALKAFDYNAADYLLKPFSKARLMEAVDKIITRISNNENSSDIAEKLSNFPRDEYLDRIVVKDRHKIFVIPVNEVRYFESMDDYVMIFTKKGRYIKQKTMKYFENSLDPKDFIRIHRSHMVRITEISEIQQYEKESYIVVLHDNTKLKVSKTGYKVLKDVLNF